jgi:hypothetical protein
MFYRTDSGLASYGQTVRVYIEEVSGGYVIIGELTNGRCETIRLRDGRTTFKTRVEAEGVIEVIAGEAFDLGVYRRFIQLREPRGVVFPDMRVVQN